MADAGVAMVLGSDSLCGRGQFGQNMIGGAELMEASGLPPNEVPVAATSRAPSHLERADMGVIEPGKRVWVRIHCKQPTTSAR